MSRTTTLRSNGYKETDKKYDMKLKSCLDFDKWLFKLNYYGYTEHRLEMLIKCLDNLYDLTFDIGYYDNKELHDFLSENKDVDLTKVVLNKLYYRSEFNPKEYEYYSICLKGVAGEIREFKERVKHKIGNEKL